MLRSKSQEILLALGSNTSDDLKESYELIERAINLLYSKSIKLSNKSKYYQTPAFPVGAGPDFVNSVISVQTDLSSVQLLDVLHQIEAKLGRKRNKRWTQRNIDIDLLAYHNTIEPNLEYYEHWRTLSLDEQMKQTPPELILPHPRIQDRGFVLVPLADIAPDWRHPVLGKTTLEMLNELPKEEIAQIRPFVL
jgi:2-amino-4-hydroxy-6-hydroxymethyldihydropteridine diphosphokinase